jgi:hypothetical protein
MLITQEKKTGKPISWNLKLLLAVFCGFLAE